MKVVFVSIGRRGTGGWPFIAMVPMFQTENELDEYLDSFFKSKDRFIPKLVSKQAYINDGMIYFMVGDFTNKPIHLHSLCDYNTKPDENCKEYYYEEFKQTFFPKNSV